MTKKNVVPALHLGRASLNPHRLVLKVGGTSTLQAGVPDKLKSYSGRHFASASDLLALTVALARILALKR